MVCLHGNLRWVDPFLYLFILIWKWFVMVLNLTLPSTPSRPVLFLFCLLWFDFRFLLSVLLLLLLFFLDIWCAFSLNTVLIVGNWTACGLRLRSYWTQMDTDCRYEMTSRWKEEWYAQQGVLFSDWDWVVFVPDKVQNRTARHGRECLALNAYFFLSYVWTDEIVCVFFFFLHLEEKGSMCRWAVAICRPGNIFSFPYQT